MIFRIYIGFWGALQILGALVIETVVMKFRGSK